MKIPFLLMIGITELLSDMEDIATPNLSEKQAQELRTTKRLATLYLRHIEAGLSEFSWQEAVKRGWVADSDFDRFPSELSFTNKEDAFKIHVEYVRSQKGV